MGVTTLQSRGQLTVPANIRRAYGWNPGDSITFTARPDGVVELRAIKRHTVHDLLEKYSQEGVAPDLGDLRQAGIDDQILQKYPVGGDK